MQVPECPVHAARPLRNGDELSQADQVTANAEDNAVPFALAEYNAGKSRVDRWVRTASQKKKRKQVTSETFQDSIDFPSTARYVRTILARYDFYKRRGPLLVGDPGSL